MSFSKKKRPDFIPIGSVLEDLLRQHRPVTTQAMLDIWNIWDNAVRPEIAANARPAAINGDLLLVHVSNSTWLHHLRYQERELIERINTALGAKRVRALKFKIGPI